MAAIRPNFFESTGELVQDAFLAWLLAWVRQRHATSEPPPLLHSLAVDQIRTLYRAAQVAPPEPPFSSTVRRQLRNCDTAAHIGENHLLLIEDKVTTSDHDEQLDRYSASFANEHPDHHIARIYLKTGDQADYRWIAQRGWTPFTRPMFLQVLRPQREAIQNQVFLDFLDHLEAVDADFMSYRTKLPSDWSPCGRVWHGFYMAPPARGTSWS